MQNFGKIASHSPDYSFQPSPSSHLTKANPEQNYQKVKRQIEMKEGLIDFVAFIQYFFNYNYEIYITITKSHVLFSNKSLDLI